jgi:hypothetical protein
VAVKGGGRVLLQDMQLLGSNWRLQQRQGGALLLAYLQQVSCDTAGLFAYKAGTT